MPGHSRSDTEAREGCTPRNSKLGGWNAEREHPKRGACTGAVDWGDAAKQRLRCRGADWGLPFWDDARGGTFAGAHRRPQGLPLLAGNRPIFARLLLCGRRCGVEKEENSMRQIGGCCLSYEHVRDIQTECRHCHCLASLALAQGVHSISARQPPADSVLVLQPMLREKLRLAARLP